MPFEPQVTVKRVTPVPPPIDSVSIMLDPVDAEQLLAALGYADEQLTYRGLTSGTSGSGRYSFSRAFAQTLRHRLLVALEK